jgi:membrane protease subunit HflC
MNKIHIIFIAVLGLTVAILSNALFVVNQKESAVVMQFGEAIKTIEEPGLNIKIPFVQSVRFLDKRILNVIAEEKELTASDEKRLIVDAFAKYKIIDQVMFIRTVHNYSGASLRLNRSLESKMRNTIGRYPLNTLLTEKRSSLMLEIKEAVHKEAADYGIEVIDVRILKADLPTENSEAIYQRMQTEREKEAKQIRAEGEEEASRIKSRADKEARIILAEAYREAQEVKGDGDAQATKLYNLAHSKDPEFYKFYRSLLAYKNSLDKENTKFLLSPKSEFLKYLQIGK